MPWAPVTSAVQAAPATWYQTSFATPTELMGGGGGGAGGELLLNATGLKRGRVWINGHDAGRYWLLARNEGSACPGGAQTCATQSFYHLPRAWLEDSGDGRSDKPNLLTLFEVEGGIDLSAVSLAVSSMETSVAAAAEGEVDPTKVVSCEF